MIDTKQEPIDLNLYVYFVSWIHVDELHVNGFGNGFISQPLPIQREENIREIEAALCKKFKLRLVNIMSFQLIEDGIVSINGIELT